MEVRHPGLQAARVRAGRLSGFRSAELGSRRHRSWLIASAKFLPTQNFKTRLGSTWRFEPFNDRSPTTCADTSPGPAKTCIAEKAWNDPQGVEAGHVPTGVSPMQLVGHLNCLSDLTGVITSRARHTRPSIRQNRSHSYRAATEKGKGRAGEGCD